MGKDDSIINQFIKRPINHGYEKICGKYHVILYPYPYQYNANIEECRLFEM